MDKLTVRPKPYIDESLSSFLYRVAANNFMPIRELLLNVKKTENNYILSNKQQYLIDTNPDSKIDLTTLAELLQIEESILRNMSFFPVLNKFFSSTKDAINSSGSLSLSLSIEKRKRRFCRKCLNNNGVFKLLWQINDIQICDIHNTKLESICLNCSREQPYSDSHLFDQKCCYCNSSLVNILEEPSILIDNELREHHFYYKNWSLLLNPGLNLINEFQPENSIEKYLAIKFLYIIASGELAVSVDNTDKIISASYQRGLNRLIQNGDRKIKISIPRLFWLLREYNMDLEDFSNIHVPTEFINSITEKKDKEIGPCLSPWCSSYLTKTKMKRTSDTIANQAFKFHNGIYSLPSICFDCYIRYGYNYNSDIWEPIRLTKQTVGVNIDVINLILPLIKQGLSYNDLLNSNLGITRFKLLYAIGYLINQSLLPRNYLFNEELKIPKNLKSCFIELVKLRGEMRKNALSLYDWNSREFFFYLNMREIQEFLLLNSSGIKKKYKTNSSVKWEMRVREEIEKLSKKNKDISVKVIANNLNTNVAVLQKNKVTKIISEAKELQKIKRNREIELEYKERIRKWLSFRIFEHENITLAEACRILDRDLGRLRICFPDFFKWMKEEIRVANKSIRNSLIINLKEPIREVINELKLQGVIPTYEVILNKVGYGRYLFTDFPELREYIDSLR
ncbi:TniQ family protein [Bacillus suaedaesalsae]|uniref:TniQ family protein n=1 Tax=Bacillus suaedaesalsae TaxID=2810349 RepID=A0ABS2DL78_9BACI|nr:TniQ family protein [Bacillus suaedaesalsae]MBM6619203.1 TniQ family protein [Bacillus suaedaesalsae]